MKHVVKQGEILAQIAKDYRVTLPAIIRANPGLDVNRIVPGQLITIPGYPSPQSIPYQIQISIGARQLRLLKNGVLQKSFPIAVGRMLYNTPVGDYIILNKAPNPGGPFGTMWMSLSKESYGIHGTNDPSSIGKAVSKGCIRMYNKDVEELARIVPIGTHVKIKQ